MRASGREWMFKRVRGSLSEWEKVKGDEGEPEEKGVLSEES